MSQAETEQPTAGALMTRDPVRVEASTTASELATVFDENEISGAPVVDQLDHVIGVVSRTDLLHRCVEAARPGSFLSSITDVGCVCELEAKALGVVEDFMNPDPVTAVTSEPIGVVAQRMTQERVHRVIIVDDDSHVLGIVTTLDMLRALSPAKCTRAGGT